MDLALAAVMAEQEVIPNFPTPAGLPLAPEILVPRIGDYLLEKGLLSAGDLQRALGYQSEKAAAGQPILLGQALLEMGLVTREVLDQVITMQILRLQTALNDANRQLERRVQERTIDLQKALARLAELNQLKSNFIANISHELRTPLTHIKGYLDILEDGGLGPVTTGQADALAVLKRSELRLERLIEDLIQFSLASRGELNLRLAQTKVEDLVAAALETTRYKARVAGVTLAALVPESMPMVCVDEEKAGWVLQQLLDNAVKFTPRGGRVEVEASVLGGLVTFAVTDTGIGIPADRIREIFEPFHQLDSSATRRYSGTGLGLAMAQRIVEAHGSELHVKSVVGGGSRFEFSITAVKDAPTEQDRPVRTKSHDV